MNNPYTQSVGAAKYIRKNIEDLGKIAIITGSGLSHTLEDFKLIKRIPFSAIPHLNQTTFHRGDLLVLENENGLRFCALNGRLHYYEGYSAQQVGFPIQILKHLGIESVIMTNAAGGLNPDYIAGQVVMIKDHINLLPDHPLRGPNDDRFGIRFPDMHDAYNANERQVIKDIAKQLDYNLNEGVYVCFQGPSLETPAEYQFLHRLGADLVGMSTVPEVIVANHMGMKVIGLSVVTNVSIPIDRIKPTTVEAVFEVANAAVPDLKRIIKSYLNQK